MAVYLVCINVSSEKREGRGGGSCLIILKTKEGT